MANNVLCIIPESKQFSQFVLVGKDNISKECMVTIQFNTDRPYEEAEFLQHVQRITAGKLYVKTAPVDMFAKALGHFGQLLRPELELLDGLIETEPTGPHSVEEV